MITATQARDILNAAKFNAKTDKRLGIIADQGSLEYWEVQMKVMLANLNDVANERDEFLTTEQYAETMTLIIQYAAMCINEANQRAKGV